MNRKVVSFTVLIAALLGCAACTQSPDHTGKSVVQILATLQERTAGLSSVYAELEMAYDGPRLRGTFDAVFTWRSPDRMRVVAFKDLVVQTRPVFGLALTENDFELTTTDPGGKSNADRGPRETLPARHPRFAAFYWAREALFLPGCGADAVLRRNAREVVVEGSLSSGARITWRLDPRTLMVRSGVIDSPQGELRIEYEDIEPNGGLWLPRETRLSHPARKLTVRAVVGELEVNPELTDDDLVLPGE